MATKSTRLCPRCGKPQERVPYVLLSDVMSANVVPKIRGRTWVHLGPEDAKACGKKGEVK